MDAVAAGQTGPAAAEQHFVERLALLLEGEGLPRMAGRIMGWLLVCTPPEQSATDLVQVLQASKASISTMTALLIRAGMVERLGRPGDRRDYYRLAPGTMTSLMHSSVARVTAMRQALEEGLTLVADRPPELRERMDDFYDVVAFLDQEYPALVELWEKKRRKKRKKKR